jgi:hypothetical protein
MEDLEPPRGDWRKRYYEGTDPISDDRLSKHASARRLHLPSPAPQTSPSFKPNPPVMGFPRARTERKNDTGAGGPH